MFEPKRIDVVAGIHTIDTMMNYLERYNAAYIMDCGGKTVMIDCGMPGLWGRYTRKHIIEAGFDPAKIDYLFITHEHVDHYGGAGFIAKLNPDVYIGVGARGIPHLVDESVLRNERKGAYQSDRQRNMIGTFRTVPALNIRVFDEDQVIDVNGHKFQIYLTPGHAPGCCSIHYLNENVLFMSDLAGNCFADSGVQYALNGFGCNYTDIIHSLKKLKDKNADYVAMGHYGFHDDPDAILQGAIDMYEGLLAGAKEIMQADRTDAQTQKLTDFYYNNVVERVKYFLDCPEPGRGEKVYTYCTTEHIPGQCRRFAKNCQEMYFPELAPQK